MDLISYNYSRPWPESLDFNGIIAAFTIASAVLCALFLVRHWRTHVITMLLAVSVLWGAWGVNEYFVRSAAHWGQRETLMAYYRDRKGPDQPFVAYQMNWKGENFYTGNHVPAFVSTGKKFQGLDSEGKEEGREGDVLHHRVGAHHVAQERARQPQGLQGHHRPAGSTTSSSSPASASTDAIGRRVVGRRVARRKCGDLSVHRWTVCAPHCNVAAFRSI